MTRQERAFMEAGFGTEPLKPIRRRVPERDGQVITGSAGGVACPELRQAIQDVALRMMDVWTVRGVETNRQNLCRMIERVRAGKRVSQQSASILWLAVHAKRHGVLGEFEKKPYVKGSKHGPNRFRLRLPTDLPQAEVVDWKEPVFDGMPDRASAIQGDWCWIKWSERKFYRVHKDVREFRVEQSHCIRWATRGSARWAKMEVLD